MEDNANMATRYEHEIPEGYEARIEGNKVIIEKKESEDERIRKFIIGCIDELRKANAENAEFNGECSEALSYLEKQKEVDYLGTKISFPAAYSVVSDAGYVIVPKKEYEEYLEEIRTFAYNEGIVDTEKKYEKEQKLVEYIKRNSKEWFSLLAEQWDKGFWKGKAEQKPAKWSEKYIADIFEKVGLAEIVREQGNDKLTNAVQAAMIELSKGCEWSEEDGNKLYQVMEVLLADKTIALRDNPHCKALHRAYDELLDWLKSLRPQPHWKPSEEQMNALENSIAYCDEKYYNTLNSLYNDLQKLL